MPRHVFISHSHQDTASAELILHALEEQSVRCWIAPRDVPPGGSYAAALLDGIKHSSCFVLVYTEHANVSPHVLREVERALKYGINIIPVRFDDSQVSESLDYFLATVHWLSALSKPLKGSVAAAASRIALSIPPEEAPSGEGTGSPPKADAPAVTAPRTSGKSSRRFILPVGIMLALGGLLSLAYFHFGKPTDHPTVPAKPPPALPKPSDDVPKPPDNAVPKPGAEPPRKSPSPGIGWGFRGDDLSGLDLSQVDFKAIAESEVKRFVPAFLKSLSSDVPQLQFYQFPCNYHGVPGMSQEAVAMELQRDIASSKNRTYVLTSPITVEDALPTRTAAFDVDYSSEDPKLRGKFRMTLMLEWHVPATLNHLDELSGQKIFSIQKTPLPASNP